MKNLLIIASKLHRLLAILLLALVGLGFAAACSGPADLETIRDRGSITVITRNNANCYYRYRGQPMGFEYDLAKAFSEHLGVSLKVVTPDWNEMDTVLESGRGDFIAAGLTKTPQRSLRMDFSRPYQTVRQQLLVHRNDKSLNGIDDLAGARVHMRRGTSYEDRIKQIRREHDIPVRLVLYEDTPTEELVRRVAEGEIDYTVADSHILEVNRRYHPQVRAAFPISEKQHLGWAVRKGNDDLLREINIFFKEIKANGVFERIARRYYHADEGFDYVDLTVFHQRLETRLPQYRHIIEREAEEHGFDWRLIAAVVYQESHFNPQARSHTGVKGLMQVTLATAREMGIENRLDPTQSLDAGVGYLRNLYDRLDDIAEQDRMLFALASYNIGYGHVRDAMRLARSRGLDPKRWISLAETLPLLSQPRFYRTTRYGYARGREPVRYVRRILLYYDILRNIGLRV